MKEDIKFLMLQIEHNLSQQKRELIEELIKKRLKLGVSQADLAKMMGTKQPAIARMESFIVSDVSMDFILKAAMILDFPVTIKPKYTLSRFFDEYF